MRFYVCTGKFRTSKIITRILCVSLLWLSFYACFLLFSLTWSLELSRKRKKTVKSFFSDVIQAKKFKACPLSVGQNTALERSKIILVEFRFITKKVLAIAITLSTRVLLYPFSTFAFIRYRVNKHLTACLCKTKSSKPQN